MPVEIPQPDGSVLVLDDAGNAVRRYFPSAPVPKTTALPEPEPEEGLPLDLPEDDPAARPLILPEQADIPAAKGPAALTPDEFEMLAQEEPPQEAQEVVPSVDERFDQAEGLLRDEGFGDINLREPLEDESDDSYLLRHSARQTVEEMAPGLLPPEDAAAEAEKRAAPALADIKAQKKQEEKQALEEARLRILRDPDTVTPEALAQREDDRFDEKDAILKQARAVQESLAKAKAQNALEVKAVQDEALKRRDQYLQRWEADKSDLDEKIKNKQIDPNRVFNKMPTWKKLVFGISAFMSGWMQVKRGGKNLFWEQMNRIIDQDLAAQKADLNKLVQERADLYKERGLGLADISDTEAIERKQKLAALGVFEAKLDETTAQIGTKEALMRAQEVKDQIAAKRMELDAGAAAAAQERAIKLEERGTALAGKKLDNALKAQKLKGEVLKTRGRLHSRSPKVIKSGPDFVSKANAGWAAVGQKKPLTQAQQDRIVIMNPKGFSTKDVPKFGVDWSFAPSGANTEKVVAKMEAFNTVSEILNDIHIELQKGGAYSQAGVLLPDWTKKVGTSSINKVRSLVAMLGPLDAQVVGVGQRTGDELKEQAQRLGEAGETIDKDFVENGLQNYSRIIGRNVRSYVRGVLRAPEGYVPKPPTFLGKQKTGEAGTRRTSSKNLQDTWRLTGSNNPDKNLRRLEMIKLSREIQTRGVGKDPKRKMPRMLNIAKGGWTLLPNDKRSFNNVHNFIMHDYGERYRKAKEAGIDMRGILPPKTLISINKAKFNRLFK